MRKLIYLLLLAVVVPFTQSCNSSSDSAKDSFLATLRSDGSKFGFMCILDNMKTAEVTDLKGTYKHTDGDRVMIYGNLNRNTGASGYNYTVDIHQIAKIITDDVKTVSTPEEDVYGNDGIKVSRAWVSGGYLNLEFSVNLNTLMSANCVISLVNNVINENKNDGSNNYFELELRNKSNLNMEENYSVAHGMACFRLGEFNPEREGLSGIKLTYTELGSKDGSKKASTFAKIEVPEY